MELKKDSHLTVPVWIRLRNLPFAFWSSQGISKVASTVGKPLYVDLRTEQMKMLTFARVCVEITTKQPSCDAIEVVHNGESCLMGVEYEWRPTACSGCGIFGHKCAPTPARPSATGAAQQALVVASPIPQGTPLAPAPLVSNEAPAEVEGQRRQAQQEQIDSAPPAASRVPTDDLVLEDGPRQAETGWNLVKGKKKDPPPREIASALLVSSGDEDCTNKEKAAAVDKSLPSTSTRNTQRGLRIITRTEAHAPSAEEEPINFGEDSIELVSPGEELDGSANRIASSDDPLSPCPSPKAPPIATGVKSIQDKLMALALDQPPRFSRPASPSRRRKLPTKR